MHACGFDSTLAAGDDARVLTLRLRDRQGVPWRNEGPCGIRRCQHASHH